LIKKNQESCQLENESKCYICVQFAVAAETGGWLGILLFSVTTILKSYFEESCQAVGNENSFFPLVNF
jgi:hypothetical protein